VLLNVFCPQYVMSYDAILCCDVLCCALLCYVVLCYVMLCDAILHYAMLCYAVLCYATVHYLFYLRLRESVAMGTLDKDAVVIAPVDRAFKLLAGVAVATCTDGSSPKQWFPLPYASEFLDEHGWQSSRRPHAPRL
jgi:hypothetical protein